jgi:hypothetical protein
MISEVDPMREQLTRATDDQHVPGEPQLKRLEPSRGFANQGCSSSS